MTTVYLEIPIITYNAPSFTMTLTLDGRYYIFRFDWNNRDTVWLLSIYDVDGNVMIGNIKLVVDYLLLYNFKVKNMPPGQLFLNNTTGDGLPCLFNDLGTKCKLLYITEE